MRRRTLTFARYFFLALIGCGLLACDSGDEAAQRKAFIGFLQVRIVKKPGIHVPKLTADEIAQFGRYAAHYAVIADFNAHLDEAVAAPARGFLAAGRPNSIAEAVAKRKEIDAAEKGVARVTTALDRELAAADAAHAALNQPDDLKRVYDIAYDRDVTQPAAVWKEVVPDIERSLNGITALADYIDRHRDKITIDGQMIQIKDASLQAPLEALIEALRKTDAAVAKSRQKLGALINGG